MKKKIVNDKKLDVVEEIKRDIIINRFIDDDFKYFLDKFFGVFIYKGKKTFAIKTLDYFFYNFKNIFKIDPTEVLFKVIKNLMPFLVTGLKTHKKRNYYVPIVVKGNKRYILVIDWIVRFMKDNSNIWGVKKEDVLKALLDSFYFKGLAINLKKEQYKKALDSRYNIKKLSRHQFKFMKYIHWLDRKKEEASKEEYELRRKQYWEKYRFFMDKYSLRRVTLEVRLRKFKQYRADLGLKYKNIWVN